MPVESLSGKHVAGIALIGDSAYVSTPFAGEGVNCALFHALELASRIIEHGTDADGLQRAVSGYEKGIFERGVCLIEKSNESATLLFAEDPMKPLKVIHSTSKE
jgi:2-polyprenyl-6-methoxyphenol hydroxylase-like FAD-dependent oxidoreductase